MNDSTKNAINIVTAAESEQIYREVFENASDCFYVFEVTTDNRFRLEAINRATEKMSCRSRADILGKYLDEITTGDPMATQVEAKYRESIRECVESRKPVALGTTLRRTRRPALSRLHLIPVHNGEGPIRRIVAITRDTTERRQMQDALRQSEQRSREVFENSSDSISLIDVTDGRLRFAAHETPRGNVLAVKSIEARGKYLEEVLPPDVALQIAPIYLGCVETGTVVNFDLETDSQNGVAGLKRR